MNRFKIQILLWLMVLGVFRLHTPAQAATATTSGIDVSSYNSVMDWEQVKSQGKQFVMIKTGEGLYTGTDDSDVRFAANYAGAGAAGLKRGAYHLACHKTVTEAKAEAQYCIQILNGRKLEYPVAYDIENPAIFATGRSNVTEMAKMFCDTMKAAGYTPMIYSSSSYLNTYFDWSKLTGVKVWVAEYGVAKPSFTGTYHMWQYSDSGSVAGANTDQGLCDLNVAYLEAQKVSLNISQKTVGIKEKFTLKATVTPQTSWDTVTFSTSNRAIATVTSKGIITGLKAGTAYITAKAGTVSAKCKVVVKAPSGVRVTSSSLTMKVGASKTLKPKTANGVYCYQYTYISSKKAVATVSSKGVVKARKKGTCVITIKTFNGKTCKVKITVK